MTKAREAADSIGKAGRGASFLLPAFSPYYVPYFPLFLRSHQDIPRNHVNVCTHIHAPPAFSFLSVLPLVSVDLLSHPSLRRSPSASPHRFTAFVLLTVLVTIVHTCVSVCAFVCVYAPRLNRRARFHVARDSTLAAARGRLCTWVNGKMSFETFLGRSRSPHCQSCTRAIPLARKRSGTVTSLDDGAGQRDFSLNFGLRRRDRDTSPHGRLKYTASLIR